MATAPKLDLSFHPVENRAPATLTAAQIEHYNRRGFIAPLDVYTTSEITALRPYFDRLLADMGPDGAFGINCYQARLAGLWDIATEPRILDYVADIVGPNIICWATAVLSKPAGSQQYVPWHQDASFWSLTPARTVTVWLAIDDADEENSAMRWIPGSHDKGHLPIEDTEDDSVFHMQTAGADTLGAPVVDALKAGQISLHADMLVHGSQRNHSDRRRCGLTLRYCPPEVRIVDEDWSQGVEAIVCRGADPGGHWRHHPRPQNDDITKTSTPRAYGNN
ncbi:MAG: phytanoyl-CoA dioxygenase family protein [Pseudomonadota bacterium]